VGSSKGASAVKDQSKECCYIVQEYMNGGNLKQKVWRQVSRRFSTSQILKNLRRAVLVVCKSASDTPKLRFPQMTRCAACPKQRLHCNSDLIGMVHAAGRLA
jgi:hypothetical protein